MDLTEIAADPITVIGAIHRRPGMTHEQCVQYMRGHHAPLVLSNPLRLSKYIQNFILDGAFSGNADDPIPDHFHSDCVTELCFDSIAEMTRTFSDDYVQNVIAPDGEHFSHRCAAASLVVRDEFRQNPPPALDGVKVLFFSSRGVIARPTQSSLDHIQTICSSHLRGYVRSVKAQHTELVSLHFRGGTSHLNVVERFWFACDQQKAAIFATKLLESAAAMNDGSFFLIAKENVVFDFMRTEQA